MIGLRARAYVVVVVLAAIGAAGCAHHVTGTDDDQALLALEAEAVACPPARLLADTAHLTLTAPASVLASPSGIQPTYEADIVSATTTCQRENDRWAVSVHLRATAGAVGAAQTGSVRLPIFVALAEVSRRIMDKEVVEVPVTLDPHVARLSVEKTIAGISAPLAELHPGPGYEVLVGFQLTPEQLEANRRRLQLD